MLPVGHYAVADRDDPIRFYQYPIIGRAYRRRVELCLAELRDGNRILEVGFGSGSAFLNLNEKYGEIHGLDLKANVDAVSEVFKKIGIQVFLKNGNVLSMPYADNYFDSILLISILEHLHPESQEEAFREITRVLKKGGQVVYGVPVERPLMYLLFRLFGLDIRKQHFSNEKEIVMHAERFLKKIRISKMKLGPLGSIYEVGHFIKN